MTLDLIEQTGNKVLGSRPDATMLTERADHQDRGGMGLFEASQRLREAERDSSAPGIYRILRSGNLPAGDFATSKEASDFGFKKWNGKGYTKVFVRAGLQKGSERRPGPAVFTAQQAHDHLTDLGFKPVGGSSRWEKGGDAGRIVDAPGDYHYVTVGDDFYFGDDGKTFYKQKGGGFDLAKWAPSRELSKEESVAKPASIERLSLGALLSESAFDDLVKNKNYSAKRLSARVVSDLKKGLRGSKIGVISAETTMPRNWTFGCAMKLDITLGNGENLKADLTFRFESGESDDSEPSGMQVIVQLPISYGGVVVSKSGNMAMMKSALDELISHLSRG